MSEPDVPFVLVTGAGGFVGSAAVRALATKGINVRAHLGAPDQPATAPPPGVETVIADLTDPSAIPPLLDGIDTILHLAGPPSVAGSFADPVGYLRVHAVGTVAMLHASHGSDVTRFVYVSSAEVYGQPAVTPIDEDAPCLPRSPYGAAKFAAEGLVRAMAPSVGLRSVILRPFSIYGPGQRRSSLVGTIVAQAHAKESVRIFDPRPIRDMVFVDDIAEALAAACRTPFPEDLAILNICSGRGTSARDLADAVARLAHVARVETDEAPDRPLDLDVVELVGDPERAERRLSWQVSTSLEVGLRRTLEAAS